MSSAARSSGKDLIAATIMSAKSTDSPELVEVRTFDSEDLLSVTWSVVDISNNMLPKEIYECGTTDDEWLKKNL